VFRLGKRLTAKGLSIVVWPKSLFVLVAPAKKSMQKNKPGIPARPQKIPAEGQAPAGA